MLDENASLGGQPAAGGPHGKDRHGSLIGGQKADDGAFPELCGEEPCWRLCHPQMLEDTHPHLFDVAGAKCSRGNNTLRIPSGVKAPRLYRAAWDPGIPADGKAPLVAHAMDDEGNLMCLNDRSSSAIAFARNFLWNYSGMGIGSDANGNAVAKPFVHAGVSTIYAGRDATELFQAGASDGRTPDIVGIAQHGVVWAGGKLSKIAEHGGDAEQDRHVPIVVWGVGIKHRDVSDSVETTQIAPTILQLLGIDPEELQAVRKEGAEVLPEID